MNYRNEWAINTNIDPHDELVQFVISYSTHADYDVIKSALRKPRAIRDEDLLKEFIKTRSPHEVLENCFYNLYEVYKRESEREESKPEEEVSDLPKFDEPPNNSVLIDHLLKHFGFREEVKPTGFSQIRYGIEQCLETRDVIKIDQAMRDLLRMIFLFYHYTLFKYVKDDPDVFDHETDVFDHETEEKINLQEKINLLRGRLKGFHKRYLELSGQLGDHFLFMRDFMKFIEQQDVLSDYCYSHFQRAVPLNKSQIAELGMFTLYRNILSHRGRDDSKWEDSKKKAGFNFDNMDDTTKNEWKQPWDYVVRAYESQEDFPPDKTMVQRMIAFFYNFLEAISENEIYPKVIVLRSYKVDEYGIRTITADVDNGETISLTDYEDFEHNTFTEFYYHSRTNPTGIEPNLVSKDQLEKWKITPTNKIENVEEM